MRNLHLKLLSIFLSGIIVQFGSYAQEWTDTNGTQYYQQSPEELRRIREQRLLEWYAQQQQNTSLNQAPRQQEQYVRTVPEAEHLFSAARNGNIDQIRNILSQGLDINVSNRERETALHMAAAKGHYSTVIFLVKNGAYVKAPTVKNWIPLHHAVRFRHPNIVKFLIGRGSSPYARTSDGLTAIDMANNVRDYRILSILGGR